MSVPPHAKIIVMVNQTSCSIAKCHESTSTENVTEHTFINLENLLFIDQNLKKKIIKVLWSFFNIYKMREFSQLKLSILWVHPRFFWWVRVAHLFSFLYRPITCFYVLSFVLWCSLRLPYKNDAHCSLWKGACLIYVICVCLRIVVSNTYCVVFFFVLCTLCCQFLWIILFRLSLRYSLTFITNTTKLVHKR